MKNTGRRRNTLENRNENMRRFFLTVVGIVLVAIITVGAVIVIWTGSEKNQKYVSAIQAGNVYYNAGDYQNAIAQYEIAIAVDNKQETGYLNIASAYIAAGNYEKADVTLKNALAYVDTDAIRERIVLVEDLLHREKEKETVVIQEVLSEDKIDELSKNIQLEVSLFDMVSAYTYTDYVRDFGKKALSSQGKKLTAYYDNMDFEIVFYDLANEIVIASNKTEPIATAKPNEVSFQSLRRIFAGSSEQFAVSYEKLQELFGETLSFNKDTNGNYYIQAEYDNCRIYIQTTKDGSIVTENAWNRIEPLNRSRKEVEEGVDGEVSGYVKNAVTGQGMSSVLKLREKGKKVGNVLYEIKSAVNGSYTFAGKQGKYTAEVSAKGYVTEYVDLEIVKGQTKTGFNVILSPEVAEGEIRIVLSWGSAPADLDGHAEGVSSSGSSFAINYQNKSVNGVGKLDVDDRNGYGPETITITDAGAEFTYFVVDYLAEGTMNQSNAIVKVYLPGKSQAVTYKVPSADGMIWEVFSYKDGTLTVNNQMYDFN